MSLTGGEAMAECSYGGETSEIVKHHSSEKCHSICQPCLDRVETWPTFRLLECGYIKTVGPKRDHLREYIRTVFLLAQAFIKKEPVPGLSKAQLECVRNSPLGSYRRFESLSRSPVKEWMPVKLEPESIVWYGSKPEMSYNYYDGVHRVCLACAQDSPVRVWFPKPSYKTCRDRQYQTLVLPDTILKGERDCDRWPLLPREEIEGKSILEIACNSAMDGIMNSVLSEHPAPYVGYDKDGEAIEDARSVAGAWGLSDDQFRVEPMPVQEVEKFPKASALFFFSASKVVHPNDFIRAFGDSGAKTIFFETHNQHNDPSSWFILSMKEIQWTEIGRTEHVFGGPKVRSLYIGRRTL